MSGTYILHSAGTEQFHWDLKAGNGETILSSQVYASKQGAEVGITSCRANSATVAHFSKLSSKDDKPYFVLKAANGEVIGTSQMYSTEATRDHGIASCRENGPSATTKDTTALS
ncbi:MAG: YegP family protein [Usitatibacter sp.]